MREIEFRGKRVDNGEWVYGSYIYAFDMVHEHCIRCGTTYAVIPETVGQYTGLHDKNGTKIFEGDVVLFSDEIIADTICGSNRYETECYQCDVLWGNGSWFIKQSVDQSEVDNDFLGEVATECEVIGNIHDKEN